MRTTTMGLTLLCLGFTPLALAASAVQIGLNDPRIGNYKAESLELRRGALLAIDRLNRQGGVLGHPLELVTLNSSAEADKARQNVERFAADGVKMVFGGASSEEAIAAGARARELGLPYFPTLAYANEVTGRDGHRYLFREANSAWMSARVLGEYLSWHQPNRRYHYISLDDAWGHSMEDALRRATGSRDRARHGYSRLAVDARREAFVAALEKAADSEADTLVLIMLGNDLLQAMRLAHDMGLNRRMQIIVPNLTNSVVEQAGATVMESVIGTMAWTWHVPAMTDSSEGKAFVQEYRQAYAAYPGSTAATAYGIVRQWADASERSGSFDAESVIAALEGHSYRLLKDEQQWRAFDHQNVQSMYAVQVRPRADIMQAPQQQDYFRIIHSMSGEDAAPSLEDWQQERGEDLQLR